MVYLLGSFLLSPAPDRNSHEDTFCTQTERDTAAIFYGCHAHCVPGVLHGPLLEPNRKGLGGDCFWSTPCLVFQTNFSTTLGC